MGDLAVAGVLHAVETITAQQLHQQVVQHLGAGTHDDLLGSDLHGTELPQVGGDGLPQAQAPCGGVDRSRPVPCSRMVWRMSRAQTVKGKSSAAMELVARSRNQTGSAGRRRLPGDAGTAAGDGSTALTK